MTDISKLQDLLKWKLLAGSHKFPGPDGGTCINEAAIVAAGYKYRKIGDDKNLPACFSNVIGQYLITINDCLPDDARQTLIQYVLKLPGSADCNEVEDRRHAFIDFATRALFRSIPKLNPRYRLNVHECANEVMRRYQMSPRAKRPQILAKIHAIIDGAFAIGKQAEPIDVAIAAERMADIKRHAAERQCKEKLAVDV